MKFPLLILFVAMTICNQVFSQIYTEEVKVQQTNGNVGIGTSTPNKKLVVSGGDVSIIGDQYPGLSLITNGATVGDARLEFIGRRTSNYALGYLVFKNLASNTEVARISIARDGANDAGQFQFLTKSSGGALTSKLTLLSNGRVGIGTQSPSGLLHVSNNYNGLSRIYIDNFSSGSDRRVDIRLGVGSSGTEALYIGTDKKLDGYGAYIDNRTGENFNIKYNGQNKFTIATDGKIGIGTSTPNYSLEIKGLAVASNGNGQSVLGVNGNGGYLRAYNSSGHDNILLRSYGISYFLGGNVGIGTTSPSEKLHVIGTVKATTFSASNPPWSDFVFDPDYSLLPLKQLEHYIINNRHLPDIPSEKEVSKEGVDLVKMNALLLQKVEELTLHIIELSKRIEILECDN